MTNPTATTCPKCHGAIEPGERFCRNCGTSLSGEQRARTTELDLLQQATLGDYEIIRVLGQGGMATVYLAQDLTLDRKVAIKVISPDVARGAEMIARFRREAKTAAALTHPHIIPIYAVKETEDLIFFVMKYVRGRSLDAILREVGPLPFPMVRTILTDIGSALDFAHRQGVVHRDVKPGNILVEEEGFAVITDFGIAKAAESESLTRSGTTVGTPSYLSPEACAGDRVGPAADQYSLGIVGYEMITGQLPFTAESSLGMMYAQVHTPPRPSTDLRSDCPRGSARHDHAHAGEVRRGSLRESQGRRCSSSRWASLRPTSTSEATSGCWRCLAPDGPRRKSVGLQAAPCSSGPSSRPLRSLRSAGESGTGNSGYWRERWASWQLQPRPGEFEPRSGSRWPWWIASPSHPIRPIRSILRRAVPRPTPVSAPSRPERLTRLCTRGLPAGRSRVAGHPGAACRSGRPADLGGLPLAGGGTARDSGHEQARDQAGRPRPAPGRRRPEGGEPRDQRCPGPSRAGAFRFNAHRFLLSGARKEPFGPVRSAR